MRASSPRRSAGRSAIAMLRAAGLSEHVVHHLTVMTELHKPVATENRIRAGADAAMGYPCFGMVIKPSSRLPAFSSILHGKPSKQRKLPGKAFGAELGEV